MVMGRLRTDSRTNSLSPSLYSMQNSYLKEDLLSDMVYKINRAEYRDQEEYIKSGRRCGAPVPTALEMDRIRGEVAAVRRAVRARLETVTVNVQFNHITNGNQGVIEE